MTTGTEEIEAEPTSRTDAGRAHDERKTQHLRIRKALSFKNIGAIYVWIAIMVIFAVWAPETFPTWSTAQTILNQNATAGLVALALVVPLSARVFDLSVGSALGLCNVTVAWLLVEKGTSIAVAVVATLAVGVLIGLVNAIVVVRFRIDSFIGTLATGSLMTAVITLLTSDQAITGPELSGSFGKMATTALNGIAVPTFVALAVAVILWYLMTSTVTGRRIYATGYNENAARLVGIRTSRLRFLSLVVSAVLVSVAGILLASQVSSGSPNIGPPYLLDAFAAAFLGATQFGGRFNAAGTLVAVLLLGTGKAGLVLVGAPIWAPSMFAGAVLLLALAMTNIGRNTA